MAALINFAYPRHLSAQYHLEIPSNSMTPTNSIVWHMDILGYRTTQSLECYEPMPKPD